MVTLLNADSRKCSDFFRNVASADCCKVLPKMLEGLRSSRGGEAVRKPRDDGMERPVTYEATSERKNPLSKFGKQLQGGCWCLFFE